MDLGVAVVDLLENQTLSSDEEDIDLCEDLNSELNAEHKDSES